MSRTNHQDSVALVAALTGFDIEYVGGATEVDDRILPPGGSEVKLNKGGLGTWRGHMNAFRS